MGQDNFLQNTGGSDSLKHQPSSSTSIAEDVTYL